MTAFLTTFLKIISSLVKLLFAWNVVGSVSIGDILVGLFIVRVAFIILVKGSSVDISLRDDKYVSGEKSISGDGGAQ